MFAGSWCGNFSFRNAFSYLPVWTERLVTTHGADPRHPGTTPSSGDMRYDTPGRFFPQENPPWNLRIYGVFTVSGWRLGWDTTQPMATDLSGSDALQAS